MYLPSIFARVVRALKFIECGSACMIGDSSPYHFPLFLCSFVRLAMFHSHVCVLRIIKILKRCQF